jgi:hypothetical protein
LPGRAAVDTRLRGAQRISSPASTNKWESLSTHFWYWR